MALDATFQKLRRIIIESTGQDGDWVFPETKFLDIGSKAERMEVLLAIECSFDIDLSEVYEGRQDITVNSLAEICERKSAHDGEVDF